MMKNLINKIKKLPKIKLFFIVFGLLILLTFIIKPSYARYIYNGIKDYYYESQSFYFNCDKLSVDGAVFQLDNWDGVSNFPVTYNLTSTKNDLVASPDDIEYEIVSHKCSSNYYIVDSAFGNYSVNDHVSENVYNSLSDADKARCSPTATCTFTKESGTVDDTTHADFFKVNITPNFALAQGDYVTLYVEVKSTSPYTKTLKGTVRLNVGVPGISYEIVDKGGQPYLDFKITNTLDYYRAAVAFGDYGYGDIVQIDDYNQLSPADQAKCTSALISLSFDPNIILVDVTSDFYDNAYSNTTQIVNGKPYINGITFGVDRASSLSIRFYKTNSSANYTYPFFNPTSIVQFHVI